MVFSFKWTASSQWTDTTAFRHMVIQLENVFRSVNLINWTKIRFLGCSWLVERNLTYIYIYITSRLYLGSPCFLRRWCSVASKKQIFTKIFFSIKTELKIVHMTWKLHLLDKAAPLLSTSLWRECVPVCLYLYLNPQITLPWEPQVLLATGLHH